MKNIIIFILAISFCSCKILHKQKEKTDTQTKTSTVDSGSVAVSEKNTKADEKYDRTTVIFDSATVKEYYITNNIPVPSTIIYERGEKKTETNQLDLFYQFKSYTDSLSRILSQKEESKKTEGVSFMQIIGIGLVLSCIVGVVLFLLLKKFP